MVGEIFALTSAVAWALSGTMLKMVSSRFGATYIVAVRAVGSLLIALAVAAAFGVRTRSARSRSSWCCP